MDGERGFSLIEILIAVWILGAVMTTMCSALLLALQSSSQESRRTALEVELRHYAEAVKAAPYAPCADPLNLGTYVPSKYTTATGAQPAFTLPSGIHAGALSTYTIPYGYTVPASGVAATFWENPQNLTPPVTVPPNGIVTVNPAQFKTLTQFQADEPTQCSGNSGIDDGIENVTLSLQDTTTGVVQTTSVLKRTDS